MRRERRGGEAVASKLAMTIRFFGGGGVRTGGSGGRRAGEARRGRAWGEARGRTIQRRGRATTSARDEEMRWRGVLRAGGEGGGGGGEFFGDRCASSLKRSQDSFIVLLSDFSRKRKN